MNKQKMKIKKIIVFTLLLILSAGLTTTQAEDLKNEFNPVQTGVTSFGIAPDARGAAMGDLGVATEPDAYSQYWNPSKYAFAYSTAAISLSYTPWLRKLVNDIYLANLSGYWKIGGNDNQAVSASLRYFSLGEVNLTDDSGETTNSVNPYEMAFDLGYSRKLSEKYSMGVALRYIYSNLAYNDASSGEEQKGGSAFAVDINGYYTTYPVIGRNECQWSFGWNISNIGSKISYNGGNDVAFLPTNLKIGTTFTFPIADYNNLSFSLDLNKLLVPTRPRLSDYEDDPDGQAKYEDDLQEWKDMSPISGIFKSFTDAPGGASEELKEINYSIGAEYSYNQQFFLRAGYFHENAMKGNRQYFGFGAGFSLNVVKLDASYMIATAQSSPLDQTLRFTLTFDMDGLKDILGRR